MSVVCSSMSCNLYGKWGVFAFALTWCWWDSLVTQQSGSPGCNDSHARDEWLMLCSASMLMLICLFWKTESLMFTLSWWGSPYVVLTWPKRGELVLDITTSSRFPDVMKWKQSEDNSAASGNTFKLWEKPILTFLFLVRATKTFFSLCCQTLSTKQGNQILHYIGSNQKKMMITFLEIPWYYERY